MSFQHRLRFALGIIACCSLAACEQVVDSTGLPYSDQMVVKGYIQDGEPVDSIYFSHTLPLDIAYSPDKAQLSDVSATITVDGKAYPLVYRDSGLYACPGLIGQAGKTYALDASWGGKHIHGETTVPILPVIDTISVSVMGIDSFVTYDSGRTIYSIDAWALSYVNAAPGSVFSSNTYVKIQSTVTGDSVWSGPEISYGGYIPLVKDTSGAAWISNYFHPTKFGSLTATPRTYELVLYQYDPKYWDLEETLYRSYDERDAFSTGGLNPEWNVTGDGFGLFIGLSKTTKEFKY